MGEQRDAPIRWQIDIPLATNRRMLTAMLKATLGSGVLGGSLVALRWADAFRAERGDRDLTKRLRNRWRALLTVYCNAANDAAVWQRVTREIAQHGTAQRCRGASPPRGYLWRSGAAVLACLPLFLLGNAFRHGLLVPLLLMCFAIASVWFVRQLAWAVLLGATAMAASMLSNALTLRESALFAGRHHRRWELLMRKRTAAPKFPHPPRGA